MFARRLFAVWVWLAIALMGKAQTSMPFKTVDGLVITGRAIAGQDAFVQVAMDTGGYTNLNWARLSQETLHNLQTNKNVNKTVAAFAAIFVDPPASASRRAQGRAPKAVAIGEVSRLDRPSGGNFFASPVMLVLLAILYAANLYAAYEISVFRQQPPALVCVVSAVAPLLGPALFLAMPTRVPPEEQPAVEHFEEAPVVESTEAAPVVEEAPAAQPQGPSVAQPVVYARSQFTFNRRFFETKFAGFMKMVPGEAERDKVIQIKSARGEHVGQRLSKVEPNEVYLQVKKGTATEDVMIPFGEIYEVTVKNKDT